MNREIRKRKKQFWAFCLALMFALVQTVPVDVHAETYTVTYIAESNSHTLGTDILKPGDSVCYVENFVQAGNLDVYYYDVDGTQLYHISVPEETTENIDTTRYLPVEGYYYIEDFSSNPIPEEQFMGWKVMEVYGSGDYLYRLKLQAAAYTQSSIAYELNGGTDPGNPSVYYEGKEEITLADTSKDNFSFDGWYTDGDFTQGPFTSVSTEWTGDVTLYAKFSPMEYNITYYNVDGATNENPASYKYGTGVTSFADASKEGYTFDGWYSDANYETPVESISMTQAGDVDLYAKFTADTYNITYDTDGGTNGAGNPTSYTYGTGVTSFADASKEGYTFDGWYSDADFTTKVTA
ncbi:MAG: InlB B-repeat-containing protein, partial [Wujia sp.]